MAIDKRLQVFDSEGNPVDYDILASDVKLSDGKDLPTKLGELEEEIGEGGYTPPQGGIPSTDLAPAVQTSLGKAETAYQKPASGIPASDIAPGVIPDVSQLATKSEVYDKTTADGRYVQKESGKDLSTNDYTNADKTKLAGISAGAEVNVIDGIIVGNTEVQPTNKKVTIPAGQDGITPHIGQNGNWWLGDENDSENDTGVTAQGPAGTSYTSADLAIGNALNGQGDVLGMAGAMQMKANIDSLFTSLNRLYSKLGNMAFWDAADKTAAAPTALDWQVPQVTVTLDKTSLSANAMITNESDQEITGTSVSVDQGSGLTLKIKPRPGYAITAASATIGGVSQNLTESGGIYTLAIASVTSAITIVFNVTASPAIPISYGTLTHCSAPSGVTNPTGVLNGQSANIQLQADTDYGIKAADITINGATVGTITHSGQVYTIPITHDGTSQSISISVVASEAIPYEVPAGGEMVFWLDGLTLDESQPKQWVDKIGNKVFNALNNLSFIKDGDNKVVGAEIDGNNYMAISTNANLGYPVIDSNGVGYTVEIACKPIKTNQGTTSGTVNILFNGSKTTAAGPNDELYLSLNSAGKTFGVRKYTDNGGSWVDGHDWLVNFNFDANTVIGVNHMAAITNGVVSTGNDSSSAVNGGNTNGIASLGAFFMINNTYNKATDVVIYAIRIYRGVLTAAQMLANQKVDNARYSLGLTLPDSLT